MKNRQRHDLDSLTVQCFRAILYIQQNTGASFGEVELLRSDELSTPRLATCTCIGQPSGGDCEVLVVTEHMFDLLTDTFKGVRSGLDLQVWERRGSA